MNQIIISDKLKEYLVSVKKRVRKENGFAPSYADIIEEMMFEIKKNKILLFKGRTMKKVISMKPPKVSEIFPVTYMKYLKELGFKRHDNMMYLKKQEELLMIARRGRTSYVIKSNREGVIYKGVLNKTAMERIIGNAVKRMK